MRPRTFYPMLVVMCLVVLGQGCIYQPGLKLLNRNIDTHLKPFKLDHTSSICLGPISMVLVRAIAAESEEDDETLDILKCISRVNVSIYSTKIDQKNLTPDCVQHVVSNFRADGWELFIKARDHEELALMFYKQKRADITALSVVALSTDEVVVLELAGDLNRIIETAMNNRGHSLSGILKTAKSS